MLIVSKLIKIVFFFCFKYSTYPVYGKNLEYSDRCTSVVWQWVTFCLAVMKQAVLS